MTDRFTRDDLLEAVLRSRAGQEAPPDLHARILAVVAADGPRRAPRLTMVTGHPWRLLAVAAVALATIGTAALAGGSSAPKETPPPSHQAITPTPSPSSSADAIAIATAAPSSAGEQASGRPCIAVRYVVVPGHGRLAGGGNLPPKAFGTVAGVNWGSATEAESWTIDVGDASTPFAQAVHGRGAGSGDVAGSSADHRLLLVSVAGDATGPLGSKGPCPGIYVVAADGSKVVAIRDGTEGTDPEGVAMSPTGLVAILEGGGSLGPKLTVTDSGGHVRASGLRPCAAAYDALSNHLLAWSRDSSHLAVRCAPGEVAIVTPDDGSVAAVIGIDPRADTSAMAWTPDGRLLLANPVSSVLSIDAVDPATNSVVSSVQADRLAEWTGVGGGSFSPTGRWLLASTGSETQYDAYLVDSPSGATHEIVDCAGGATCMWASDSSITIPTNTPTLVSVPEQHRIAGWSGGSGYSSFTLLP